MNLPVWGQAMKTALQFLTLSLFLSTAASVHGDGIPVARDFKSVTVESFTIQLNADQVKQVERLRKVTLTDAQSVPLLAIYDKCPRTIEVVSSRYGSCTCDFGLYAIWCRPGEIKIPHDSVASQKDQDEYDVESPTEEEKVDPDSTRYEGESLIQDSEGNTYIDGKEIKEADILALIDAMYERQKQNDHLECYLNLDVPPPMNAATDTRVRELVKRLEAHCEKRSVNFWAEAFSVEKNR